MPPAALAKEERTMEQRQIYLRDILTVLFKRKVQIIGFAVIVILGVFVGNIIWPETYESQAKIQLVRGAESSSVQPTVIQENGTAVVTMNEFDINSEIQIIFSNDVLGAVVKKMGLESLTAGRTGPVRSLMNAAQSVVSGLKSAVGVSDEEAQIQAGIQVLRAAIVVRPIKDSFTLEVLCRLGTPKISRDVLTETLAQYREYRRKEIYSVGPKAIQYFNDKLVDSENKWKAAQGALKTFRETKNVYEIEIENELLTEQYSSLLRSEIQLKEIGENLEKDPIATLSRETDSTVITEQRLQLLRLVNQRNETATAKGKDHPELLGLVNQIEKAESNLLTSLEKERQRIGEQKKTVEERRKALAEIIDEHDILQKQVELRAEEYEFFSNKVKETSVMNGLLEQSVENVRVVQNASTPTSPIRPRKAFNMIIGIMAGVVGGIALAFFLEYLDHGIKTPEDVEHFFNVAPLASFFGSSGTKLDDREAQRLNSILEALYSDQPLQFIGVASSIGGENSHQVARTLADAAAGDPDGHVLLIDFDGAAIPEAASGRGLLDVVLGEAQAQDVVTTIGDLYVMSRGTQKDCPVYLWNSERMREVIADLRGRFKRIIFHVPPVLSSHDAVNLVRHADGMIVVVKTDSTRREVVMRSMETLAEAKGRVLGAVLTDRKQLIPKAVYKRI
ncbi:MAG: hypothetical protein AMXMBFR84_09260 [Candidatus Hydrogenedentota bacterium]